MENLQKKYERDMKRIDKKLLKMAELDKKGVAYDPDEVEVTDSEPEQETPVETAEYDD